MTLKETLLAALGELPGTREFHLHVLVTGARKDSSLYRHAAPRPRTFVQDILVLLAEETAEGGRKFVAGLEAHVYTVPATQSGILYVSKVDSTGQGTAPAGTCALVRAFITYYADPGTRPVGVERLWVHLFARAQGQYLFPNSAEYAGKRVLSDVRLCGWWRRVLGDVEAGVRDKGTARLYYVLPGYEEDEAVQLLGPGPGLYGHPYGQDAIGLPCGRGDTLGHWIPSFDDDPKARFLDELADGGTRKRKRDGELGAVGPDEFWARMAFRQECVAGAVTGFFALGVAGAVAVAEEAGHVPVQVLERIRTALGAVEFSTGARAARGTAAVEGAIAGLCAGLDVSGRVRVARAGAAAAGRGRAVRMLSARRKQ
ncbi:hypothetical protein C0993_009248 [Termitomyces sp. T159_Od127]|nr:hypothetical protein C0993_009248 [Termitomyces sp. T159_Od127]